MLFLCCFNAWVGWSIWLHQRPLLLARLIDGNMLLFSFFSKMKHTFISYFSLAASALLLFLLLFRQWLPPWLGVMMFHIQLQLTILLCLLAKIIAPMCLEDWIQVDLLSPIPTSSMPLMALQEVCLFVHLPSCAACLSHHLSPFRMDCHCFDAFWSFGNSWLCCQRWKVLHFWRRLQLHSDLQCSRWCLEHHHSHDAQWSFHCRLLHELCCG